VFFLLGFALYSSIPWTAAAGSLALFVAFFFVILSMYGGGFATVPAYLADIFGTKMVGAIHGRLLTAWSMAGILGPVIVSLHPGVPARSRRGAGERVQRHHVHSGGLLAVGFLCNWLVKPVAEKHYMKDDADAAMPATAPANVSVQEDAVVDEPAINPVLVVLAWLARLDSDRVGKSG
jgi:MFS family permease